MDTVQRLREILLDHEMTVAEFSERTGISAATLAAAKTRHTQLNIATIERVCNFFGMPMFEFFIPDAVWDQIDSYYRKKYEKTGNAETSDSFVYFGFGSGGN